jgi:hypothetical protein
MYVFTFHITPDFVFMNTGSLKFVIEFAGYWVVNQSCAAGMRIKILVHLHQH